MTAPEFPNALPLDAEAWENALDDAWPREGGRSRIVRVLATEVVRVLAAVAPSLEQQVRTRVVSEIEDDLDRMGHLMTPSERNGQRRAIAIARMGATS